MINSVEIGAPSTSEFETGAGRRRERRSEIDVVFDREGRGENCGGLRGESGTGVDVDDREGGAIVPSTSEIDPYCRDDELDPFENVLVVGGGIGAGRIGDEILERLGDLLISGGLGSGAVLI